MCAEIEKHLYTDQGGMLKNRVKVLLCERVHIELSDIIKGIKAAVILQGRCGSSLKFSQTKATIAK